MSWHAARARLLVVLAAALWFALAAGLAAPRTLAQGKEPPAPERRMGPFETSCVTCHAELDDSEQSPAALAKQDVHFAAGLSCNDCHGGNPRAGFDGDPEAAHDASFRGKPDRLATPLFCARCHADAAYMKRFDPQARVDQHSEYVTSVHGRRNAAGDPNVATCVDCHGMHGVLAVKDPRASVYPLHVAETCARCHSNQELMATYGRRGDPHADYRKSVHAHALYETGDLSAPTCNDCHGSHGAAPPGVDTIANVCGSCHGREATLFRDAEMSRNMNLEACIQCAVCHSNHAIERPTIDMLGTHPGSTCVGCHLEGDAGWKAAGTMRESLERIGARLGEARDQLDRAGRAGVEVGPDRFALQEADDSLIEARVLVHGFDLGKFSETAAKGLAAAEAGIAAGERAFAELRYRRVGLALSLIVIAAVILALALVIRGIEA